jgi:hypothetical protein
MNNKQATIAGLQKLGAVERVGASRKYRVFDFPEAYRINDHFYLVGKSGALRVSSTTISASRSITDSRIHLGFQYVGRLGENWAGTRKQAWEVWSRCLRLEWLVLLF